MNRRQNKPFNMIEIVLALAVIAVGMVSIMALFPVGLTASRNAVAESYGADSADQFLHWYAAKAKANWGAYVGGMASSKPGPSEGGWLADQSNIANLQFQPDDTYNGVYRITFEHGSGGNEVVDFSGIYRIWRDTIQAYRWNDATSSWVVYSVTMDEAVAINLEASWPAEIPYTARTKKIFRLEVFQP